MTHPMEWLRRIEELPGLRLQTKVAQIVWWDHFSLRTVGRRWPHLDAHIRRYKNRHEVSETELENGLVLVGYSEKQAKKRARSQTTRIEENAHRAIKERA